MKDRYKFKLNEIVKCYGDRRKKWIVVKRETINFTFKWYVCRRINVNHIFTDYLFEENELFR